MTKKNKPGKVHIRLTEKYSLYYSEVSQGQTVKDGGGIIMTISLKTLAAICTNRGTEEEIATEFYDKFRNAVDRIRQTP